MITRDEPILIASRAGEQRIKGVHTHVHPLGDFLASSDGRPIDGPQRGAEILIDFLESEEEVRRAGRAALEKFRSDYDADVVAPRLVSFLRSAGAFPVDGSSPIGSASQGADAGDPRAAISTQRTGGRRPVRSEWIFQGEGSRGGN